MPILGRPSFQPKEALSKTRQYPENAHGKENIFKKKKRGKRNNIVNRLEQKP
jgi:hypothetical protein